MKRPKTTTLLIVPMYLDAIAVGDTIEEVRQRGAIAPVSSPTTRGVSLAAEALEFHFEGLLMDNDPIPTAQTIVEYVDVEIPRTTL